MYPVVKFNGEPDVYKRQDLTDYLFEKNHRKIAFISSSAMDTPTIADRFSGFVDSNLAHGIITNETMWVTNLRATIPDVQADEGMMEEDLLKLKRFLLEHPEVTAYFVVEYEIAKMLKKALKEVYGEIADTKEVVCFDGPDNVVHEFAVSYTHLDVYKRQQIYSGSIQICFYMAQIKI